MSQPVHEHPVAQALLDLVDAPVRSEADEQVLHRLARTTARLPDVGAAGCILADPEGTPHRTAASHPSAGQLERIQRELLEGPGLDGLRTSTPLPDVPLAHPRSRVRWPRFSHRALAAGFTAVTVLPIRYGGHVLGSLDLYHQYGAVPADQVLRGQLLANATGIGLAHRDALRAVRARERQLQTALDSRVVVEQAKGILAERLACSVDEAFDLLRQHARSHQAKLADVAAQLVNDPADTGPFARRAP